MKRRFTAVVLIAGLLLNSLGLALALPACKGGGMPAPGPGGGASGTPAWGMAGGGPQRQGLSAYAGPDTPEIAWEYVLEGELLGDPNFDPAGNLYIAARRTLLSLALGGEVRWRYSRHGLLYTATYLAADNSIRAVFNEPSIACLNPDGSERWVYGDTGATSFYTVTVTNDGWTYLIERDAAGDSHLICLDPAGIVSWEIENSLVTLLHQARRNFIYARNDDSILVVLDANGNLRWQLPPAEGLPPYFVGSEPYGGAYVVHRDSTEDDAVLRHYDSNGDVTWAYQVENQYTLKPFIDNQGFVYLRESDGTLTVISAAGVESHTTVKINYIAGMDDDGLVYAVAPAEGGKSLISLNPAGQIVKEHSGAPDNLARADISSLGYLASNSRYKVGEDYVDGLHLWDVSFNQLWQYSTHERRTYTMLLDSAGTACLGAYSEIAIVDASGQVQDELTFDGRVQDSLAIGPRGLIYYCDEFHSLFALLADGNLQWEAQLGGRGSPHDIAVTSGGFYIPSDFLLFALNRQGETNYVFAAEDRIVGGPAVALDGTVCFVDRNHNAYAVGADGKERWHMKADGPYWDYPVIAGKKQVLLSADHGMVALDLEGNQRWDFKIGEGTVDPAPAVGPNGTIYAPIRYDPEYPAEEAPGSPQQPGGGGAFGEGTASPPSHSALQLPGNTVVLDNPDTLGICSLTMDGDINWYVPLEDRIDAQPIVDSQGRIYTLSYKGTLSAINELGELLWTADIPNIDGAGSGIMALSPQNRIVVLEGGVVSAIGP